MRRISFLPCRWPMPSSTGWARSVSLACGLCTISKSMASQAVDLPKVAADLGIDAILSATFIHEGDDLRVAGQLIDIKTHGILWNGGFDVKYKNLLTVQEKVARQIVRGFGSDTNAIGSSKIENCRDNRADGL